MKLYYFIKLVLLLGAVLSVSCTHNPFSNSTIEELANRTISGTVKLEESSEHSKIFVYLEKLNIYTWTDSTGRFKLTIPKKDDAPAGQGITDKLNLQFYVNNYEVVTANVLLFDNAFKYDTEDIDGQGVLKKNIVLKKVLDIDIFAPNEILLTDSTLSSAYGVVFSCTNLTNRPFSLTTNVDHHEWFYDFFVQSVEGKKIYTVKSSEGVNRTYLLRGNKTFKSLINPDWLKHIPSGKYKVFFYGAVKQELPNGLLNAIGEDVLKYDVDYLNLPIKYPTPTITIINNITK